MTKQKVMVVDDSALMRKIIGDMISDNRDLELIATARDGVDALQKLEKIKPDVITLDVEMPRMDGITTLQEVQKRYDIPVIMLSSLTAQSGKVTIEALAKGAYDFIEKPSGSISLDISKVKDELVEKIRNVKLRSPILKGGNNKTKMDKIVNTSQFPKNKMGALLDKKWSAIVIGASTGGPKTLTEIISGLPENKDSVPIFIVQHMPKGFTASFAERLDSICALKVVEAKDGERINRGHVYIAPGDFHMMVEGHRIMLDQREKHLGVRPAVDYLFRSAAPVYKDKLLSIILTGMGRDGTEGMEQIKKWGGTTIAQDKESSIIFGMPGSAIESGIVDTVLSLEEIAKQLHEIVKG